MTDRNQELISDAEEEQIQKMIDSDLDSPEVTDEQLAEDRLLPSRSGPFRTAALRIGTIPMSC